MDFSNEINDILVGGISQPVWKTYFWTGESEMTT